jgi:hypothetical protein
VPGADINTSAIVKRKRILTGYLLGFGVLYLS